MENRLVACSPNNYYWCGVLFKLNLNYFFVYWFNGELFTL